MSMVTSTVPVFAAAIEHDGARAFLELAAPDRHAAEVIGFEARGRVRRIELIRVGGHCVERQGGGESAGGEQELLLQDVLQVLKSATAL